MEDKTIDIRLEEIKEYSEEELRLFAFRLSGLVAGNLSPLIEKEIVKILKLPQNFFGKGK